MCSSNMDRKTTIKIKIIHKYTRCGNDSVANKVSRNIIIFIIKSSTSNIAQVTLNGDVTIFVESLL